MLKKTLGSCVVLCLSACEGNVEQVTPTPSASTTTSHDDAWAGDASVCLPPEPDLALSEVEPIGTAQEPWLALVVAFLTCEYALHHAGKYVCENDEYWATHCPPGKTRIVHDVWKGSGKSARISCDTVKDLVCDLEGGVLGFSAFHVVCAPYL